MTARLMHAPPLRFLALVLCGWICLRIAVLAPGWLSVDPMASRARPPAGPPVASVIGAGLPAIGGAVPSAAHSQQRGFGGNEIPPLISNAAYKRATARLVEAGPLRRAPAEPFGPDATVAPVPSTFSAPPSPPASVAQPPPPAVPGPFAMAAPPRPGAGRWSGSAWLLARREQAGPALAPGGTLGGSQAGARILYRVNRDPAQPLALSARVYVPLHRIQGAEAAAGIDWQPVARLPVHILAERRQALGDDGRSAFAATLYGGISRRLPHGLRIEAYGQAGVVGVRARDLFADGAARIAAPAGPVEIGGALRGAAQPGAARLDAGPELSVRIRAGLAALRLSADWRFRIAGGARPDSGPALTLAADF